MQLWRLVRCLDTEPDAWHHQSAIGPSTPRADATALEACRRLDLLDKTVLKGGQRGCLLAGGLDVTQGRSVLAILGWIQTLR